MQRMRPRGKWGTAARGHTSTPPLLSAASGFAAGGLVAALAPAIL